jgi:hypothetical protein
MLLFVALAAAATVDVQAPAGCVDPVEVSAALDEIGGIDIAETVRVQVTPRLDEYALVVDIALAQAAPLHREVALRPRECQDVADLVAVLVQSQRRAALEARLLAEQSVPVDEDGNVATGEPQPKPALPAMDPRTRGAQYPGTTSATYEDGWSPCEGPAQCGGFRFGLSLGLAYPLVGRGAIDTGWDVTENLTAIAAVDTHGQGDVGNGGVMRIGGGAGVSYRTRMFDFLELSARGLLGGGGGTSTIRSQGVEDVQCVPDESGNSVPQLKTLTGSRGVTSWYVAPSFAMRARIGYLFGEVGTTWHLNLDQTPNAYVAIGIAPFGN